MKNGDLSHFWISKENFAKNKNRILGGTSTDGLLVVRTLWFKSDAKARVMWSWHQN